MKTINEQDFLTTYEDFSDALFRHCYFRISDRSTAEDMVQNIFIKAWEYLEKGNEVKNLRALLYKIANDMIIDEYRRKKALSLDELRDQGFDLSSSEGGRDSASVIETGIEAKDMLKLLDGLDHKYREVIVMRYINEFSPQEISQMIGESENNVSVRLNRALKQMRELLNTKANDK